MTAQPLRLVLFGVGGVGCAVARLLESKTSARIVAAVDPDPAKQGRDVADLAGLTAASGVVVSPALPRGIAADVAIQATTPDIGAIEAEIVGLVRAGMNVVSVSGAFFIAKQYPEIAARIDRLAREHGVSVFATGSTPGFFSDVLPAFLTQACARVDRLRVRRVVDMSRWGAGMYAHYGIGLSPDSFEARVADGSLKLFDRLRQSLDYIAASQSWRLDQRIEQKVPRLAAATRTGNRIVISPGDVCGFTHRHIGLAGGVERVVIDYTTIVGLDPEADGMREATVVEVEGCPSARLDVSGDILTDPASPYRVTAALAVNAAPHVAAARPGLLLAHDLPLMPPLT